MYGVRRLGSTLTRFCVLLAAKFAFCETGKMSAGALGSGLLLTEYTPVGTAFVATVNSPALAVEAGEKKVKPSWV